MLFRSEGSTITRNDDSSLKLITINPSEFATSIHLPDDATIVMLETTGRDGANTPGTVGLDIVTTLGRTTFAGAASVMATTTSAGGGSVWNTTSIATPVVDNGTHSYWVRVKMSGPSTLFAVRVLYRVTSPLP